MNKAILLQIAQIFIFSLVVLELPSLFCQKNDSVVDHIKAEFRDQKNIFIPANPQKNRKYFFNSPNITQIQAWTHFGKRREWLFIGELVVVGKYTSFQVSTKVHSQQQPLSLTIHRNEKCTIFEKANQNYIIKIFSFSSLISIVLFDRKEKITQIILLSLFLFIALTEFNVKNEIESRIIKKILF